MNAISPIEVDPDPIEIDPRPCEWCGLKIDRHQMIDSGEGPEFFCFDFAPEELSLAELERRDELRFQEEVAAMVARMELADPRDRWRHTGEQPPARINSNEEFISSPYRTPQSTIDAFWYVVRLGDPEYLIGWLARHPLDAPVLHELWERKNASA
jgi:hypothetical protein